MQKYPNLAKPISIGSVFIKNRVAMAPMNDLHQFYDPIEGTINRRWIDYFLERARGGVGLIITGAFKVEDEITKFRQNDLVVWALVKRKSAQNYAELAKYVHAFGGRIFMQMSAGPGRVAGGQSIDDGFKPVSASVNRAYFRKNVSCRELTTEEVDRIVDAFGWAARIVKDSGFDGIEVHGHEGYLIDQFVTALWNRRTDKYGGDLEGRLTFPVEILKAIKKEAGQDYPVIYRYGSKHFIKAPGMGAMRVGENEMGRDLDESVKIAQLLEKAGYDALHVDAGAYESAYWAHPPIYLPNGFSVEWTSEIKRAVRIPVIAVGRLGIPEIAEKTLADGKADMIALGRDLLSDPYWPKKVLGGKPEEAKLCIGCHECMNRAESGQYLTCAVNPFCGNEGVISVQRASKAKRIMVVGGGVGGMEAALTATRRGHQVTIYEKTETLGGHLLPASIPDFKRDIKRLTEWYKREVEKNKIKIEYKTEVTPDLITEEEPDIVFIATGSTPIIPEIPGVKKPFVSTCIDVLLEKKHVGDKVVLMGGGLEGCETALWLAQRGKKVTIVEMLPQLNLDIHRSNKAMLLDLLSNAGVGVLTGVKIISIDDRLVRGMNENRNEVKVECDSVVLAVGLRPSNSLYRKLLEEAKEVYGIGDCMKPRKIADAIWEGAMVALRV
jgi:2-enoate reductase